jgi:stage II sporulation protein R
MKKMRATFAGRWRLVTLGLLILFALAGWGLRATGAGAGEEEEVAFRRGNLIRLHVIANSDSADDQRVKLMVRDDILRGSQGLFRDLDDAREARAAVAGNLELFRRLAERRLRAEGFSYPARVSYGVYPFPARTYGRLTLPAGRYTALRVILGRGDGHNWWCVLFPPLCFLEMDAKLARDRVKVTRAAKGQRVAVRVKLVPPSGPAHPVPLSVLSAPVWP